MIITIISVALFCAMFVIYFVKYNKLRKKVKNILNELEKKSNRKGYYKVNYTQTLTNTGEKITFDVVFEIKEIEKYTDDMSKIELEKIEIINASSNLFRDVALDTAKNDFCSLRKTSKINWLEPEINLKEQRKEKLNQLKKAIKQKS